LEILGNFFVVVMDDGVSMKCYLLPAGLYAMVPWPFHRLLRK
jgi:hypothetical protein